MKAMRLAGQRVSHFWLDKERRVAIRTSKDGDGLPFQGALRHEREAYGAVRTKKVSEPGALMKTCAVQETS